MDDMWTSPPLDILLEVFRHLGTTDVVRCAGVSRPWRRAILIGNPLASVPTPTTSTPTSSSASSMRRSTTKQAA
ncbi:hypothetical protein HU200_027615 [Digitaria exilis]|uniref:F-box domain-containing protein n=1 Tax=Digitaria exilis TaxID=1010633 RepID=A0A835EUS5_9POAL|nr:hypothetical protein HU200_027615 [Digitaria exilis]